MNRLFSIFLAVAVSAGLFAETVVKNSASFAFPTTVGLRGNQSVQGSSMFFAGTACFAGKGSIVFSWKLPVQVKKGVITIFRVDGSKIKSFTVASPQGNLQWDISRGIVVANGVYLATLSCGTLNRDCKVVLYR